MKKKYNQRTSWSGMTTFCLILLLGFSTHLKAQLTGTKNIPGDYADLAAAITDLNTQGVGPGGVTLNIISGNPQTAPAGGYAITTLTSSAANPVVITGNGNTITASAALTAGALNDAIFKVIGSDYVTIQQFTMQENAANTTTTAASNNMTEWGVAVLYATQTDGAKNVTIQNNTISLDRTYQNTFGIYANSRHSPTAPATAADITSPAGALDNLHIYGNNISNTNLGITVVGSTTAANEATGLDIGGNGPMTGNTLTNIGTTGTFSGYISVGGAVNIIYVNNNANVNVSYNSVTSSTAAVTSGVMRGIFVDNTGSNPTGTITTTINSNTISLSYAGTTSNVQGINMGQSNATTTANVNGNTISAAYTAANSGTFSGIVNSAGTAGTAISISGNNFQSISFAVAATAAVNFITNTASTFTTQTISGNTFTNISLNISGNVNFINTSNSLPAGGTRNVNGNSIVGTFAKTGSGGTVQLYNSNGTGGSTGTETTSGNNFSNITLTGTTNFAGWLCQDGSTSSPYGPGKTVTGNTFSNITVGTGTVSVLTVGYSNSSSGTWMVAGNTISNITAGGAITGMTITQGNQVARNNTVSGINSTAGTAIGITVTSGITNTVAYNKVYDIQSGAASGTNVYGISVTGGTTNHIYNNLVGDLKAPVTSGNAVIAGIRLTGGTTDNIFYNTVLVNASGTGTNFGTSALSCSTGPSSMNLRNNILINKSTPAGTGTTAALRREATSLTTYAATSNNNIFYAGTPGAANLIYSDGTNSDQTLAAFQTRVAGRETFSVTEDVSFLSTTGSNANFLHVNPAVASAAESGGTAVSGITDDIDGDIRFGNPGYAGTSITAVDIGADEFDGTPAFTCTTPAPGNTLSTATSLCLGAPVTLSVQNATPGTGVSYQWQSSTDGVSYSNIAGATSTTYSVVPSAAIYYQLVVTCGTGPVSAASTPVHLTFANSVTATTPATRCGVGTVNLEATPSAGVINWYAAATGGTAVGTGSPFTTPSIGTTTTYYAAAEVVGSAVNNAIGAGGTTGTGAPYDFANGGYGGMKTQYLYTAAELTAAGYSAGNISSIAYEFTVAGSTLNGFNIQMGTTALTDLPTPVNIIGGLSTVYTAASMVPAAGVNTYTLSTPFYWDGASNLLVSISWSNNNTSNTASTIKYDATAFNSSHSYRKDSETAVNLFAFTGSTGSGTSTFDRSTNRPRTIFSLTPVCSSARVPVVATVNTAPALTVTAAQTVCNDAVATISVTSTVGDFDQYIWTPQTNLFTDAAGTVPYTGTSESTIYVRTSTAGAYSYSLNANNTSTQCSQVASTTVTVVPGSLAVTASAPFICVSGAATLSVTPSTGFGVATLQWQDSPDNVTFTDIASATGATYATPAVTSTTYYAVQLKIGATVCTTSPTYTLSVTNPTLVSTTPATRCGTGTAIIEAAGSAGTTVNWYAAASGGLPIGTGSPFTTPSISSTTTYYAAAEVMGTSINSALGAGSLTGTGAPYNFTNGGYGGMKTQYLYTASELIAAGYSAGNINSIGFEITSAGSTLNGFNIQMGTTALTTFPTPVTILGGLTTVYTGTMVPTVGVNTYTLSTPFAWDGASNLVISLSWSNNNTSNSSSTIKYDATTNNMSQSYRKDSETAANMFSFTGGTGTGTSTFDRTTSRPLTHFNVTPVCSGTRTAVQVTVTTPPAITVTATNDSICPGTSTTLDVTSSNPGYSYTWNGSLSGAQQTVSPSATATYTVDALDMSGGTNDGCTNRATIVIALLPPVNAVTATASDVTICAGDTIDLNSTASVALTLLTENFNAATNNWTAVNNSVNGTVANAAWTLRPSGHNPLGFWNTVAGINSIASNDNTQFYFTNSDSQGSGSTTDVTLTSPRIDASFASTLNLSFYHFFRFNAAGDICTVSASTDGTTWTSVQTYTATTGAATNFAQANLNLNAFAGSDSLYIRYTFHSAWGYGWAIDNVVLDGTTANLNYAWTSSPAGFTSSVQNPADVVATASTTYSVTVTNAFGCSSSATASITANPLPTVVLGNDTAVCASGLPVTLDAGNAGATFLWNDMSTDQTLSASAAGSYDVAVTDANGCIGKDTIAIAINPDPVVTLGSDTIRCGGTVTLDAGNAGSTYMWSDLSANQTLTVSATGNYDVAVTDANGCVGYDTIQVTINTIPTVDLGNDTLVCGTGLTLDAGNAGNAFLWNTTEMTQTINVTITGDYFVDVTTPQSCTARDTVHVTIAAPITVDLGNDSAVCASTNVILDAQNAGSTYLWNDNTTGSSLIVTTPGAYSVIVTSPDGCTAQDTVVFTDNSPAVDLTLPFSITCVTTSVNALSGGSPVGGFYSGTAVTGTNFDATTAGLGTHVITYTYTDGTTGCFASDTQSVMVDPCVGIKQLSTAASIVIAPNPTTGYFSINMPSRDNVLKAEMYTVEGQLISSETYKGREVYEVNITELANAVYYMRLTVDGETNVVKIVKQQ